MAALVARDYQEGTIVCIDEWFQENTGNPCVVLPTASGKSVVIALFCKTQIARYRKLRIVVLAHVKELIQQNADKLREAWPTAPLGIYSAGLNRRELYEPITVASIQSIYNKHGQMPVIDIVLVDEAHLIPPGSEGMYHTFFNALRIENEDLVVIGFTATPFRMGQGSLTHGHNALFTDLIEPPGTSIPELIERGFLAPLFSKATELKLASKLEDVHKRGGEYIEGELQVAVDTSLTNEEIARETVKIANALGSRAIIMFCTGVAHAEHMAEHMRAEGIHAECVTGETPKRERDDILNRLRSGKLRCVTNPNVLTTGFDYPDIDLIALVRPTLSKTLYHQMVGRGMRLKSHTDRCTVLDFAGCVALHGPVTDLAVLPPGSGGGEAPTKECPSCAGIIFAGYRVCPQCGHEFPLPQEAAKSLHNDDIMGGALTDQEMFIRGWHWRVHTSKTSGKEMLLVRYESMYLGADIMEYIPIMHDGFAGNRAMSTIRAICREQNVALPDCETIEEAAQFFTALNAPTRIRFRKEGHFTRVLERDYSIPDDQQIAEMHAADAAANLDDDISF